MSPAVCDTFMCLTFRNIWAKKSCRRKSASSVLLGKVQTMLKFFSDNLRWHGTMQVKQMSVISAQAENVVATINLVFSWYHLTQQNILTEAFVHLHTPHVIVSEQDLANCKFHFHTFMHQRHIERSKVCGQSSTQSGKLFHTPACLQTETRKGIGLACWFEPQGSTLDG